MEASALHNSINEHLGGSSIGEAGVWTTNGGPDEDEEEDECGVLRGGEKSSGMRCLGGVVFFSSC